MGMAASQARYLALTARKTNTEWEGQQINQARLALANKTSDIFNKLLNMKVPAPPEKTKYTELQYTYSDGENDSIIENYEKIGTKDPDYNYIVRHYFMADVFQGAMKKLSDPQVHYGNVLKEVNFGDATSYTKNGENSINVTYPVGDGTTQTRTYNKIDNVDDNPGLKEALTTFEKSKGLIKEDGTLTTDSIYGYQEGDSWHFFVANSYNKIGSEDVPSASDDPLRVALTNYESENRLLDTDGNLTFNGIFGYQDGDGKWHFVHNETVTEDTYVRPVYTTDYYTAYGPAFVGNSPLTELTTLSSDSTIQIDQVAELAQILRDCPDSNISKYVHFDSDGNLVYSGSGIYQFKIFGNTYYTTLADLETSYNSKTTTTGNSIDAQERLNYYNATYVPKKVEETNHALLETDGNGRFKSIKFDNDTNVYTLNISEVTDEAAYESAYNKYLYDKAQYEKTIADLNAKTSIIHQEDRTLELRLKQLETEQNALSTEMDAVKKVIKDNVEKTFKTFSD